MYERNIETLSGIHFCSGKAMRIAYSEAVSVALVNQLAIRMCLIICCLTGTPKFFHVVS